MVAFVQTSIALLLAFATVSNSASLRQDERSLAATYTSSTQYASAMLARINKERAAYNLPPVCSNRKLQAAAQRHVKDQSKTDYMSDYGTDDSTPEQRVSEAGYKWHSVVESIDSGNADVDSVVDWWMKNADRDHILGNTRWWARRMRSTTIPTANTTGCRCLPQAAPMLAMLE